MKERKKRKGSTGRKSPNNNARLCVDHSSKESFEAIEVLREAGFRVSAALVSGLSEPELTIGSSIYRGIAQIKQVAKIAKESLNDQA